MRYILAILLILVCGNAWADTYYKDVSDTTYYDTSATSCDDVTAADTAGTVTEASAATNANTLYVCPGEYRETLTVTDNNQTVTSSTGNAADVVIIPATQSTATGDWSDLGSNQWATANSSYTTDVGFMLFGSEAQANVGTKVWNQVDVDAAKEFFYDATNDRVIVYCTQNPVTEYTTIEIGGAQYGIDISNTSGVTVSHMTTKYFKSVGVKGSDTTNATIKNMEIHYGGGVGTGGTNRAGNGIQLDGASTGYLITLNNITQIWDSAIGPHVFTDNDTMQNGIISKNKTSYCAAGVTTSAITGTGNTVTGITIKENIITYSGHGWSGTDDNSEHGRGVIVTNGAGNTISSITINDNRISYHKGAGVYCAGGTGYDINSNFIFNGDGGYDDANELAGGILLHGNDWTNTTRDIAGDVYNNIIANNARSGIAVINNQSTLNILNNTLYDNGDATYPNIDSQASSAEVLNNNDVYSVDSLCFQDSAAGSQATLDYNRYYRASGDLWDDAGTTYDAIADWRTNYGEDANSVQENPDFISPGGDDWFDYRPRKISTGATGSGIPDGDFEEKPYSGIGALRRKVSEPETIGHNLDVGF